MKSLVRRLGLDFGFGVPCLAKIDRRYRDRMRCAVGVGKAEAKAFLNQKRKTGVNVLRPQFGRKEYAL